MEQKEAAWSTWWASRLCGDDGSQSIWEKEQAVIREKKKWWFHTYGEPYWTREDKELQWRTYWEEVHGEGSEPFDGLEKKLWWEKAFREEYVRPKGQAAQIGALRSLALRRKALASAEEV
jgi:hypothetical protein